MLIDWQNGFFERHEHLRPSRRMTFPAGGGLAGLIVSFGCWYVLGLVPLLLAITDQNILAMLQAGEAMQSLVEFARANGVEHGFAAVAAFVGIGIPYVIVAAAAAVWASMVMVMLLFGQWLASSTGGAFAAVWRAWNGHTRPTRADIRTILGAGLLLALWLVIFGVRSWFFVAWDAVLAAGIGAVLWRLRHPAQREYFGDEARAELRRAAKAAGRLGMACLVVLGVMVGNSHTAIATMAAPWPTVLAIAAAGVLLGLALPVERHLRSALAIAKRNRADRAA